MESVSPALRLAVVYPWSSEMGWVRSFHSMLRLKHPPGVEMEWGRGHGWCSASRHNHALRQALDWGADLILILGADQVYHDHDMLYKFVEHYRNGHECVTALVPMRGYMASQGGLPFSPVGWRIRPDADGNTRIQDGITADDMELVTPATGPLVRIHAVGSGVLMFPASALRRMSTPWCAEVPTQPDFDRASCADASLVAKLQVEGGCEIMCDTTVKVTHLHPFEIDETFSERFKDWAVSGGDKTICDYRPKIVERPFDPSQIDQARVSTSLPFYKDRFLCRYGLRDYDNKEAPAFFFGLYNGDDFRAFNEHVGAAIIIWAGTDIVNFRELAKRNGGAVFGKDVSHVAISSFIADDLDALGIKYKRLNLCNVDESKFKPVPRGKAVYCYCPDHDREKYGGPLLDEVMAKMPDTEFIVQRTLDTNADMQALYEKCLVNLRLTQHDGLSNSVVECGLVGRPSIWNGEFPDADGYETADDIVSEIRRITGSEHDNYEQIAARTRDFITLPPNWKDVAFYDETKPTIGIVPPDQSEYDYQRYFDWRYSAGERGAGGPEPEGDEAAWTYAQVLTAYESNECESLLEVGCGAGVRGMASITEDYLGVDISPVAIDHARRFLPANKLRVLDITKDEIPEADCVTCVDVAQHLRPEDFVSTINKLYDAARKVLFVKTSVGVPTLKYQFDNNWNQRGIPEFTTEAVPGTPYGRIFVFKKPVADADVRRTAGAAVETPRPGLSLVAEDAQ